MAPQLTWSSLFSRRFYAGLVLAVGALFVAMFLSEWWPIAISRDAELVAKYPFASEHAMSEGGWTYANPELYAWTAFGTAAFALGGTILLASAIIRRSKKLLIGFVAVLALHWGLSQALSRYDWDRRQHLRAATMLNDLGATRAPSNPALKLAIASLTSLGRLLAA